MSFDDLAAEKEAQLRTAKAVLRPITAIVMVAGFVVCFRTFQFGVVLSLVVATLMFVVMWVFVALAVGYVLGRRAARRFKRRIGV